MITEASGQPPTATEQQHGGIDSETMRENSVPLPIHQTDSVASRGERHEERLAQQLAYWQAQLTDAPALLELPTDRPRPAVQRDNRTQQPLQLDATLMG